MSAGSERSPQVLASLPSERAQALLEAVRGLSSEDLTWLSGYSAGVAAARAAGAASATAAPGRLASALAAPALVTAQATPVTILYGTHSGTSKKLAERLAAKLAGRGASAQLVRASDYPPRQLAKEQLLVLVVATHGDGDPADDTRAFYDFVLGKRAPKLAELRYAVLGLGDSSYPKFCHVARQLDERLAALGATRLAPRGECDGEVESVAGPWLEAAEAALAAAAVPASASPGGDRDGVVIPLHGAADGSGGIAAVSVSAAPAAATKAAPAVATVLVNQQITSRAARKRVLHLELATDEQALAYQTGDALGIWPHNAPWQVAELVAALGLSADTPVAHQGKEHALGHWLTSEREITKLSRPLLAAVAERTGAAELVSALRPGNDVQLATLLGGRQVVDVLSAHRTQWSAAELVAALRPLAPRSYSIASSPLAFPGEAHLTVAHVAYVTAEGQRRAGAASDYLARLAVDDALRAFVEPNPSFRLPSPDADLLMVGPGTGVAPFRAFVQERELTGGRGRSWLFFGEQHRRSQFLYQVEWQAAVKRGSLHRVDLAFSRDQEQKIYVQHRLLQRGRDVWAWLDGGAHFYVCGDAKHMAPDVEAALLAIAAEHGGKTEEGAQEWLSELRGSGRYHRDVY